MGPPAMPDHGPEQPHRSEFLGRIAAGGVAGLGERKQQYPARAKSGGGPGEGQGIRKKSEIDSYKAVIEDGEQKGI